MSYIYVYIYDISNLRVKGKFCACVLTLYFILLNIVCSDAAYFLMKHGDTNSQCSISSS